MLLRMGDSYEPIAIGYHQSDGRNRLYLEVGGFTHISNSSIVAFMPNEEGSFRSFVFISSLLALLSVSSI